MTAEEILTDENRHFALRAIYHDKHSDNYETHIYECRWNGVKWVPINECRCNRDSCKLNAVSAMGEVRYYTAYEDGLIAAQMRNVVAKIGRPVCGNCVATLYTT